MKMICPHCGVRGTAEDSLRDRQVKCPKCNGIFVAKLNNIMAKEPMDGQLSANNSDGMLGTAGVIGTDYIADPEEILDEREIDKILSGNMEEGEEVSENKNDVLIVVEEPAGTEDLSAVEIDELIADNVEDAATAVADELSEADVDENLSGMDSFFDDDLPEEVSADEFSVEEFDELLDDSDISEEDDGSDSSLDEYFYMDTEDEVVDYSVDRSLKSDEEDGFADADNADIWATGSEVTQKTGIVRDADVPVKCAACGEYFKQGKGYKLGTTIYCDKCVPRKSESERNKTGQSGAESTQEVVKQKGFFGRLFSRKK